MLGAAALLAVSALAFATAMVMAPPLVSEHTGQTRVRLTGDDEPPDLTPEDLGGYLISAPTGRR